MKSAPYLLALALVLTACAKESEDAKTTAKPSESTEWSTRSSAMVAKPQADKDAPSSFKNRAVLADCGVLILHRGDRLSEPAVSCIENAPGDGAELVVASPTFEGELTISYFRGGGTMPGLEVFSSSPDGPNGGSWSHSSCETLRALQTGSWSDCDDAGQPS